ncbi:hypothetical protein BHE74_00009013, partial [Ensete ventricosum]
MDHLLERLWWEAEAEDSLETEATHPSFFTPMATASVPLSIPPPATSPSLFSVSPYSSQILVDRHSRPKAAAAISLADGLTQSHPGRRGPGDVGGVMRRVNVTVLFPCALLVLRLVAFTMKWRNRKRGRHDREGNRDRDDHGGFEFSQELNSCTNPGDLAEKVNSGTNPGNLVEKVNSGTNSGDLAERVNSGTNPGDLAERVNSGTNSDDLAEKVNSVTNLGDLAKKVNSSTNPGDLVEKVKSGTNSGDLAEK